MCVRWNASHRELKLPEFARFALITVAMGEFTGREGSYFLNRKQGEQRTFSFEHPTLALTRDHALLEKPPLSRCQPHPFDESSLENAKEIHLTGFAKIATGLEGYVLPPTLNRSAIAALLVDSTPGGMMRAVVTCLFVTGVLPNASPTSTGLGTGGIVL